MPNKYDYIILGSGIAGLSTAIALAHAKKKVLVVGRKGNSGEATEASGGILDPMLGMYHKGPLLDLRIKSFKKYPQFIKSLEKKSKININYKRTGLVYVACNVREQKKLKALYKWQSKCGIPVKVLKKEQIRKICPDITNKVLLGLHFPSVGKLDPIKLKRAMEKMAVSLGAKIIYKKGHERIKCIEDEHKHVIGIRMGNKTFIAVAVVNALGSWASHPAISKYHLPIMPVRGQMILLSGKLDLPKIVHSVKGNYIVPWKKNSYLLGSTVEFAGYKWHTTIKGLKGIRKNIASFVPNVQTMKRVKAWAGLRPYSEDNLPLIGPSREQGLFYATGYFRSGILIGPLAGELLAKGLLSGKMPKILKPFDPRRFEPVHRKAVKIGASS